MFNVGLIDSLKVRVRRENVDILDQRLITDYIAYYPSIDAFDDDGLEQQKLGDDYKKAEPFTKIIKGITYRFYLKAFLDSNGTSHEYVVFQISAKMLKHRYFEGITADNWKLILNDINDFGVLKVTADAFLNGLVSDIDICLNQLIDRKSLKTAFSFIKNNPINGKHSLINVFEQKNNIGIEFNKRDRATNTAPYCKIYHKGLELQSKSSEFFASFLSPVRASFIDNLVRFEFTIKAAKHKKYLCEQGFSADFKTFFDLMATTETRLASIAKSGLTHYLEKKLTIKTPADFSPMEIVIQYYMANLIDKGFDKDQLMECLHLMPHKQAKSRMKSKLNDILAIVVKDEEILKSKLEFNERSNKFLTNLGVKL